MADYRVKIGSTAASLPSEVLKVGWDAILSRKRDSDGAIFNREPKSEFVISCRNLPATWDGYDALLELEGQCKKFEVSIEVYCGGSWSEVWTGEFTSNEWVSNRDAKTLKVKARKVDNVSCLKTNWTKEINLFDLLPKKTTFPYFSAYITHEESQTLATFEECPDPPTVTGFCYEGTHWDVPNPSYTQHTCVWEYHRLEKNGTCSGATIIEPDTLFTWNLLSGGCPGTPVFWTCPATDRVPFTFVNGRSFNQIFEYLVDQLGCGLSLVSDLFNINADGTHPDNDVYDFAVIYFQNLLVYQKSDIKRHDASDPSRKPAWNMKLQDLLNDLKIIFNGEWKITDDVLRFEHISYFESVAGNDYTDAKYTKELAQDKADVLYTNRFAYRDNQCSDYFKGSPIIFNCGEGEGEKRLTLFSMDIEFISDIDNAESVGDDGWVLLSTIFAGSHYNADNNRGLSWTEIHDRLYKYNMPGAGNINGMAVDPISLRKVKKQPSFAVPFCCDDEFDPAKYIITSLGHGDIEADDWHIAKDYLELTVKY